MKKTNIPNNSGQEDQNRTDRIRTECLLSNKVLSLSRQTVGFQGRDSPTDTCGESNRSMEAENFVIHP